LAEDPSVSADLRSSVGAVKDASTSAGVTYLGGVAHMIDDRIRQARTRHDRDRAKRIGKEKSARHHAKDAAHDVAREKTANRIAKGGTMPHERSPVGGAGAAVGMVGVSSS